MTAVKISEQQRADFMNIFNADTIKSQQADPNEVTLPSGQKQVWSNEEYGAYIRENYTVLYFLFQDYFAQYRQSHDMTAQIERLKPGLDEVSLTYLERHEQLLDAMSVARHCLVEKDFAWTPEDKKRFAHYQECKAQNPLLQKLSLDYGSIFTNQYGLYDLPEDVANAINGKDIIDAGAFIGDNIWLFRDKFPQSHLYCFEPDPRNFKYLNIMFSDEIDSGMVQAFNMGLGEEKGLLHLSRIPEIPQANPSSSFFYNFEADQAPDGNEADHETVAATADNAESKVKGVDVDIITIDDLVADKNLQVGLIKMDVEGFEPHIVRGALNTIRTQRPVLAISIYHTPEEFYELKPFFESLDLNYQFQIRRNSLCAPLFDIVLICYPR